MRNHAAHGAVVAHPAGGWRSYSVTTVAAELGYRDHGGVGGAVRRVERGTAQPRQTAHRLGEKILNP